MKENRIHVSLFVVTTLLTIAVVGLLLNIIQRKQEARDRFAHVVPIADLETDPEVWGHNFPDQYDGWKRTAEAYGATEFGGGAHRDKLALNPRLKELYAGYPFSLEYRERRGHARALEDVIGTKRMGDQKPGTCMSCKSSDNVRLWNEIGPEKFFLTPMRELQHQVSHSVSCLNCHDPKTMDLRPANPAFLAAMKNRNIDLAKATRQEMRTYVCAQCHVEYYFETPDRPILHFPWENGLRVEEMERHYDAIGFADWEHPVSGAKMIKAQHPDYELWSTGIHARAGVACADCHMPFRRVGAQKISDHWVRSPLVNIAHACQTCHRQSEEEMRERVVTIQRRTRELMDRSEVAIIAATRAIAQAKEAGAPESALEEARALHRRAQFRWDFVSSENSMGFHSPQEAARLLGEAIDFARQAEITVLRARTGM
ncbi:MAG TPA: ammonia-forming cytochrome c nitrite reductase subunit c552 [Armatimonadota bacterium]|nr:ammonia-forming cytochrome c nitrite reductase subunit c552 [Armatimonadota bacterium]